MPKLTYAKMRKIYLRHAQTIALKSVVKAALRNRKNRK